MLSVVALGHHPDKMTQCQDLGDDFDMEEAVQSRRVLAGGFPSSFFHDDDMDTWYETAVDVDKAKQDVAKSFQTVFRYYNV